MFEGKPVNSTLQEENPIEIYIDKVNNINGTHYVKFNQKLHVPKYLFQVYDQVTNKTTIDYGVFDQLAIMDIKIELNDHFKDNDDKFDFYTRIEHWDEDGMEIYLNFTDPLEVSTGKFLD